MKVTVEVDCTPIEARKFFGLPDVQQIQAAIMSEMEKSIMKEAQRFSPEAMMKTWFTTIPQNADLFREMFSKALASSTIGVKKTDAGE